MSMDMYARLVAKLKFTVVMNRCILALYIQGPQLIMSWLSSLVPISLKSSGFDGAVVGVFDS